MARDKEKALIEVVINGQKANASIKEMDSAVKALGAQLKKLPKDSQEFADKKTEFQKMSKELRNVQNDVKGIGGIFQSIGKEIKGFGVIAIAYLGFDFLKSSISNIIKSNGELSDSLADIRKTTGMTEQEAKNMNTAFSQINTRTATKELRNIAIVGGQLGIVKGEILGFTVAVDKMNVALGDEFTGGAEEVTKAMGGLRNIFTDIKSDKVDQDLLHIGNAINELASKGAATGPVVSDFANRIGGVGITLGLTSGQVLGLSATLQELNVSTERGGTAVTRILQKMTTNVSEFAKVAKMPVKEFAALVNKDLYGAFVKVAEGSKQIGNSATAFGKILNDLGVDGAGASEVFAKLGSNTAMLDEKVKLANTSLKGTNSIMNEFNIKNNTLGADIENIGKGISSWFKNSSISDFLKDITSGLAKMVSHTTEFERLSDAWKAQKGVVDNLQSSMVPLLHRHDELKGKSTLNKDEQKELNDIIQKVSETIPFAVTEFDKYGKAMDINTSKGRDFVAMEEKKLEVMNKDALFAYRQELIEVTKTVTKYQDALHKRDKDGDIVKTVQFKGSGAGTKSTYESKDIKLTNDEIVKLQENLRLAKDQQIGFAATIAELSGTTFGASKLIVQGKEEEAAAALAASFVDEEASKKIKDNRDKLLERLREIAREQELSLLSETDRELQIVYDKYDKLRVAANGNKDDLKEILKLEEGEVMALLMKQFEKQAALETKAFDDKLKRYEKLKNDKEKMESYSTNSASLTPAQRFQKETDDLNKTWITRIDNAKNFNASLYEDEQQFAIDITALEAAKNLELQILNENHNNKILEQNRAANVKKVNDFNKTYQDIAQITDTIMAARSQMDEREIASNKRTADSDIKALKKLVDNKVITQKQYEEKVAKIEADREARDLKIKQERAEREKTYSIFKIILNTAVAVTRALAEENYYEAIAAGALGVIELGIAASTPVPQFGMGGYSDEDPEGYTSGPTLYNKSASGRPFIAGEKGTEYIVPNWMVQDPVIGPQIADLDQIRVRGYASGGYNSEVPVSSSGSQKTMAGTETDNSQLINALNTLNSQLAKGISARLSHDLFEQDVAAIEAAKFSSQVKG